MIPLSCAQFSAMGSMSFSLTKGLLVPQLHGIF